MKQNFLKLHSGLFLSMLVHGILLAGAAVTACFFWIDKIQFLPVYPIKYAMNGLLIVGIAAAIWDISASKVPSKHKDSETPQPFPAHLISFPVPAFLISQFLESNRLQPGDRWIPYANTILIFFMVFASAFIWHKLICATNEGHYKPAKQ